MAEQHTPVADDWNWKSRVRNELEANKAWHRNWGFLLDSSQDPQQQHQQSQLQQQLQGGGGDALATFMQQAGGVKTGPPSPTSAPLSYIAAKQRDSVRARRLEHHDSLDGFVNNYMVKGNPQARQLPVQEFRKPLITSHEYGWGRNLEVFGKMTLVLK